MIAVLAALLPVFLLMIMGFALRHRLLKEDAHWIGLERRVYYVLFPALLIQTTARANLTSVPVGKVGGALHTIAQRVKEKGRQHKAASL